MQCSTSLDQAGSIALRWMCRAQDAQRALEEALMSRNERKPRWPQPNPLSDEPMQESVLPNQHQPIRRGGSQVNVSRARAAPMRRRVG